MSKVCKITIVLLSLGLPFAAAASGSARPPSPLIDKVRAASERYRDVNVAVAEGWVPATPCVSGPNSGAMGVHFLLPPTGPGLPPPRIGDGVLNVDEPEALIYEPVGGTQVRLVGVEYIVLAGQWKMLHPDGSPPVLEGHLMNLVGEPNRYGLPAFFELHVWAWERNPNGSFADWNSLVSCDRQPAG